MVHDLQNAERCDVMNVTDEPHDWYAPHPFDEDARIPVPYDSPRGEVLLKRVEYDTTECEDCGTAARKDAQGIPVCPDCGLLCTSPDRPDHEIIADPKTAERVDDNGNFIQ